MLVTTLALAIAAQPARPFAQERVLLDRRLETLRRILPDGPNGAADALLVRQLGAAARLTRLQVQARPPVETGTRGDVVLDVSALGGYEEVDRFFQKLALSHRLVDVESLTLSATTEDVLQLAAVLRLPYWPARAPLPAPPESARPSGASRAALRAYERDQALAFGKSEAAADRRRGRRTARLFLSELAAVTRDRPVTLAYASLGDGFTLRGLALGEGPLASFAGRLERGFFRVSDFLIAKQAGCHRFEAHGVCPVAGPDAELPVPTEDPFDQEASPCRVDRDAAKTIAVRGRVPGAKDPGGPLTLRLRDVDLADAFRALSLLGLGAYVVDDAVAGRVSVELTRATAEEALAAIRKSAGLELVELGPLRRVSLTRSPPRSEPAAGGPLASFATKRAEVRDLLAAMAEVDPGLASLGPPGFLGRVSVFATDTPVAALRGAVLEAAGLTEKIEEDRRILEKKTGGADAPSPVARSGGEPRLVLRREQLTVRELELAGLGVSGETRVAFAYSPRGELYAYRPGDRLFDGVVRAIEDTEVVLDTEDGPLRLALPPLD